MNGHALHLAGADLVALPSGALWWPEERILTFSDLHLGKAERAARRGNAMLPPYEIHDTLARMEADIAAADPATVICLGDSFDDLDAVAGLVASQTEWLIRLQAGRNWVWITGNHDPAPLALAGSHMAEFKAGPLVFRHVAQPDGNGEISGHFHPKATVPSRGGGITRKCFLFDARRVVLPAYGTYTGGLHSRDPLLRGLMSADATAILTGERAVAVPLALCR